MNKTLLFCTILLSHLCSGQISLEHTYTYSGISRVVLENSGEKYYRVNKPTQTIQLFNADHSLWKTIPITIPAETYSVQIHHLSETKINPDDNIEISYTTEGELPYQSQIINEQGTVLLATTDMQLLVDSQQDLPIKIISKSAFTGVISTVYSTPDLSAEHTYTESEVKRVTLESSGENYYTFDKASGIVNIYDANHTLWKVITLIKPDASIFTGALTFFNENQLNSDEMIEVGYAYKENNYYESKIINEDGDVLLTVNDATGLTLDKTEGLADKLYAHIYQPGDTEYLATDIYSIATLSFEHSYPSVNYYMPAVTRVNLELSGEKYYTIGSDPFVPETIIYNGDHTVWKTIATPNPYFPDGAIIGINISETKIDEDNQIELAYTCSAQTLDGGHYVSYVINESGVILLTVDDAIGIFLSELEGVPRKLITSIHGEGFGNTYYAAAVYGWEQFASVEDFTRSFVMITPNPASSYVSLQSNNAITNAGVYDLQGRAMSKLNSNHIKKIDVADYPEGLYLLDITDADGNKSIHKLVVSH